jgi:hypothetical protein
MVAKIPPMTIYANLMEEARYRIEAMNAALSGKLVLPNMILEEFVYLQIRLLCEIIALGCLVVHGDFTQEQLTGLRNEYDADTIIKNLAALNPTFYPIPIRMTVRPPSPGDPGEVRLDAVPEGSFLTKDDLLSLYGRTGNYLHRGKLKQLESRPPYAAVDMSRVIAWAQKVLGLLDQHRIRSPDNLRHWLCALKGPDGKVMMAYAQSPQPSTDLS